MNIPGSYSPKLITLIPSVYDKKAAEKNNYACELWRNWNNTSGELGRKKDADRLLILSCCI